MLQIHPVSDEAYFILLGTTLLAVMAALWLLQKYVWNDLDFPDDWFGGSGGDDDPR